MIRVYVAGAWTEQHQRARPMMSKLREAGHVISHDWTQAEGYICACGHPRSEHARLMPDVGYTCGACECSRFNGIGVGSDATLTPDQRRTFAQADLDGVLSADVVWLLAANDKGACGSWVELGAALTARSMRESEVSNPYPIGRGYPTIVVSGPKCRRTIFTELADKMFETDEEALAYVLAMKP